MNDASAAAHQSPLQMFLSVGCLRSLQRTPLALTLPVAQQQQLLLLPNASLIGYRQKILSCTSPKTFRHFYMTCHIFLVMTPGQDSLEAAVPSPARIWKTALK
jgi:hypothetical protein